MSEEDPKELRPGMGIRMPLSLLIDLMVATTKLKIRIEIGIIGIRESLIGLVPEGVKGPETIIT